MPYDLVDFLHYSVLVNFAGSSVYRRGLQYFRLGRVTIVFINEDELLCTVYGTHQYEVRLKVTPKGLSARCTCPHAAEGNFCKHMVAAGIAGFQELSLPLNWKWNIDHLVDLSQTTKPLHLDHQKYFLFFSLQERSYKWFVLPYYIRLDQINNLLPDSTDIAKFSHEDFYNLSYENESIIDRLKILRGNTVAENCLNCSLEEVAFAKILLKEYKDNYQYYYGSSSQVMGDYLVQLAKHVPSIFKGMNNYPAEELIHFHKKPVQISLRLNRTDKGLYLDKVWRKQEGSVLPTKEIVQITNTPPLWFLMDDQLLQLSPGISQDLVNSWREDNSIVIPKDHEKEFWEDYFPKLAAKIPVESEILEHKDIHASPVPRLYVEENEGKLQVRLKFGYGEFDLDYAPKAEAVATEFDSEEHVLSRIHRDLANEDKYYKAVSSAAHGLKRAPTSFPEKNLFLLRAKVYPIDFLLDKMPNLISSGFEIYGEEKLKSIRVNRSRPTVSLNVSSGIDWFDVNVLFKYGDTEASLSELRKAIRKKRGYVKLADGSMGAIPEEWIKRYKYLWGMGEKTDDDSLRFHNYQMTMVDQLLLEAEQTQTDDHFDKCLKKLKEFSGIEEQPLSDQFIGELRPYQQAGVNWMRFLHDYGFGGCLADDMGLGKTVQVLAFLQAIRENGEKSSANLIVVPRSLLVNWEREVEHFTPNLRVYQHFGLTRAKDTSSFDQYDVVLTTYGVLRNDLEIMRGYHFDYVVLDESQAIKNPVAKISKTVRLLNCSYRLVMTGTPVENTTLELWSQFAFLNPGLLGNLEYFKREFGKPIEQNEDEQSTDFLRKMVYPFIMRRTKEQVAPDLPPRTERVLYASMEPAQRDFYQRTRDEYRKALLGEIEDKGVKQMRMKVLEGLLRLRQICNHPRIVKPNFRGDSAKLELLKNVLENLKAEGHRALIFSQFVTMLKILQKELDTTKTPYLYLDGRTRKRQDRVDQFQVDDSIPFFLISLKAGGVGLNLTAADYVIHIDPWWNPAVEMQATDRTHRIGQEKPVFVYKMIVRDSVEEKILQLQERKKGLVNQLIATESSFLKNLSKQDVEVLFS